MTKTKAVLFDRDGVLNKSIVVEGKPFPPRSVEELELTEGIEDFCSYLKKQNFKLFMITNQPDIARQKVTKESVDLINDYLKDKLSLDYTYCCPHDDSDNCLCRKPLPGMIHEAEEAFNLDLANSIVIGDRWKDIQAGISAGCKTVFIDYNYDEKKISSDYILTSTKNLKELFETKGL